MLEDQTFTAQFKTGDDIHFDYSSNADDSANHVAANEEPDTTKSSKKKKKKNKRKNKLANPDMHATLNHPEDDYPTSRVIKQAPNGDVVVEPLDDVSPPNLPHIPHHDFHDHTNPHSHSHTEHNHHTNIWDSATIEEQENLKLFWESLDEPDKMELVKIDKKSILEIFRNETRANAANQHHNGHGHTHPHTHSNGPNSSSINNGSHTNCACKYCGRRSNIIEDELENIYDNHFDVIIDFIHEVRDINDLNALPGLLFGGFHMLEEEHKLQKRQQQFKRAIQTNKEKIQEIKPLAQQPRLPPTPVVPDLNVIDKELTTEVTKDELPPSEIAANSEASGEPLFQKLLDPKIFEALENLDFDKIKETFNQSNVNQANILEKAGSLREMIKDLHKADEAQLEKGMSFLHSIGKIFSSTNTLPQSTSGDQTDQNALIAKFKDQFSHGLSSFAEDLLKNDGNSFIDMMESLSESRTAREDLLKTSPLQPRLPVNNEPKEQPHIPQLKNLSESFHDTREDHPDDQDQYEDDEEYDEDEEDDQDDDGDIDDDVDDGGASDTESEISEEEKMQEIRRLFLIQVIKLFQERLKNAYKKKLSEDRTQKLIEELEAEENAKKEKELKKLKQKEKVKEKKRLQQLAKEGERKKQEEELKEKEEEQRKKLEELREEQKRRKEEARLKREEEKKKRIEELKRKEEENRKKAEALRKKEEEAKKLKEERKKKLDEERKKKEEEKKQKEVLKKQKEEERELQKLQFTNDIGSELLQETDQGIPISDIANEEVQLNTASPASNHILQQLYQAKPGSASSTSSLQGSTPAIQHKSPFIAEPSSANNFNQPFTPTLANVNNAGSVLNTSISPNTHNNMVYGSASSNVASNSATNLSPWSNKSRLNSIAGNTNTPSSLFPNQFSNTNFSPFNTFGTENINPLSSNDPFVAAAPVAPSAPIVPTATQAPASTIWNQPAGSRNNSIWNTASGGNGNTPLWNPVGNIGGLPNSITPNNGLGGIPQPSGNLSGLNLNGIPPVSDNELIQTAGFNAFRMLQQSNQLDFGVAPLLKLFQATKNILGNTNLSVNQFLGAFRTSKTYQFDFIYDDFGTVTHIKAEMSGSLLTSTPPGFGTEAIAAPAPQQTPQMPINGLRMNGSDSSLLKSFGDLELDNSYNVSNNFNRGLWN